LVNAAINESLAPAELRISLAKLGHEPKRTSPQEFAASFDAEMRKWSPVLPAAGLRAD
jgi:tripartite-type tricarboxylate transporter receptor subunit TctC